MIHVIATLTLKSGKRADFIAAFKKLAPLVLAEKGCIAYGPTVQIKTDIPAQGAVDESSVVVVEQWTDVAALKAHLDAPHMHTFRANHGAMIEKLDLKITKPA